MNIKRLSAVGLGHFSIDVLNSSIAVLLTVLSGKFDLSISQIGLAAMIYTFAASLTQPFFGMLADYLQGRWLGAISVAWTASFFALAAFMPSYPLLVTCLTIGALGSGAFHPVGMINAAAAGGRYPTTATSVFFLLGQSGLALGPMAAGLLLQYLDIRVGLPLLALSTVPAIVLMALHLSQAMAITPDETDAQDQQLVASDPIAEEAATPAAATPTSTIPPHTIPSPALQSATVSSVTGEQRVSSVTGEQRVSSVTGEQKTGNMWQSRVVIFTAFLVVVAFRAATMQSLVTLLPRFFSDQGFASGTYGMMIGVFAFAGALGTFFGGYLGDRVNRRLTLFFSTLLSVPFCYALLQVEGWLFYPMAAMAGALLNIPHSILIIMAQRLLPKREGMMGGMVLGFMFASGAIMTWIASWLADLFGLGLVLSLLALLPTGAAFSALLLPSTRTPTAPAN